MHCPKCSEEMKHVHSNPLYGELVACWQCRILCFVLLPRLKEFSSMNEFLKVKQAMDEDKTAVLALANELYEE